MTNKFIKSMVMTVSLIKNKSYVKFFNEYLLVISISKFCVNYSSIKLGVSNLSIMDYRVSTFF